MTSPRAGDVGERRASWDSLRSSRDQLAIILREAADGVTALDREGRFRYANDAAARMLGYPSGEAMMAVPWTEVWARFDLLDEADEPILLEKLPSRRVLNGEPRVSVTIRLRPHTLEEERWLTIRATPVHDDAGEVELSVTLLHEITSLKQAELSQRVLAELGRILATPWTDRSLRDVAEIVVPLLADGCALDVRQADGSVERILIAATDAARDLLSGADPTLFAEAANAERSAVAFPLVAWGEQLGTISVVRSVARHHYSQADFALLEEFARRLALGLDNARLLLSLEQRVQTRTQQLKDAQRSLEDSRAQLRRLSAHLQDVREEERVRIAREIHDELGQALVGLNMDVAWLGRSLGRGLPAVRDKLDEMTSQIHETVQSVRRISSELRPSILDDLGLSAALEWQLGEFQARTGLECVLDSHFTEARLDPARATAVFRIFQEALTNVARHAQATRVRVTIEESPVELKLSIQDDGRGIRPEELGAPNSFGVLGMRERVHLFEGELEVSGAPGEGTRVQLRIPLPEPTS